VARLSAGAAGLAGEDDASLVSVTPLHDPREAGGAGGAGKGDIQLRAHGSPRAPARDAAAGVLAAQVGFLGHLKALLLKRAIYGRRDKRMFFC
jgi:hypothetical protein